jgi:hypothetical protein
MKTKNLIVFSFMFLTVLSSCTSDDEKDTKNSDIVGIWSEAISEEQFIYIFNSNGQGLFQVKNCNTNELEETVTFTYRFDEKRNKITLSGFQNISFCYVRFISKTSIQLYYDAAYTDEWSFVMYKQIKDG